MADNVAITGSVGAATASIPGTAAKGLYVDPRGSTTFIQVAPTISAASIYAAKDAIGGIMTFANAARTSGAGGIVESVMLADNDQELSSIDLILFSATVAGTVTDNAAFDPTDADLLNCLGTIQFLAGDYADFSDNSVASRAGIGLAYKCAATSLFGVLVARGTPTYTAVSDITVTLGLVPD